MERHVTILAIALLGLILAGCANTPTGKVTNEEPIVIGATLALSGDLAFICGEELRGLAFAVEDINAAGGIDGRQLRLVIDDNKGDAKEAVTGVARMLDAYDAAVIFSAFTHITSAVEAQIEAEGRPLIYASTIDSFAKDYAYGFRDYMDAAASGEALAKRVIADGQTSVAYIGEISDVCTDFYGAFEQQARSGGIAITGKVEHDAKATALRSEVLKLVSEEPDAIVSCSWRQQHLLVKELEEQGSDLQLYGYLVTFLPVQETPELARLFAEHDTVTTWYGTTTDADLESRSLLKQRYIDEYGREPRPDVFFMYDDVQFLAEALGACAEDDAACISDYMIAHDYVGVSGALRFDRDGVSQRDVPLLQAAVDGWVEV